MAENESNDESLSKIFADELADYAKFEAGMAVLSVAAPGIGTAIGAAGSAAKTASTAGKIGYKLFKNKKAMGAIQKGISENIGGITKLAKEAGKKAFGSERLNKIRNAAQEGAEAISKRAESFKKAAKDVGEAVQQRGHKAIDYAGRQSRAAKEMFKSGYGKVKEKVSDTGKSIEKAKDIFVKKAGKVKDDVVDFGKRTGDAFKGKYNKIREAITSGAGKITNVGGKIAKVLGIGALGAGAAALMGGEDEEDEQIQPAQGGALIPIGGSRDLEPILTPDMDTAKSGQLMGTGNAIATYVGKDTSNGIGNNNAAMMDILQKIYAAVLDIRTGMGLSVQLLTKINTNTAEVLRRELRSAAQAESAEISQQGMSQDDIRTGNISKSDKKTSWWDKLKTAGALAIGGAAVGTMASGEVEAATVSKSSRLGGGAATENDLMLGSGKGDKYSPFVLDKVAPNDDRAKQAMAILMKKGWSKEQAAGIVANIKAESDFNIRAKGDRSKKTGEFQAHGIAQWHPDRQRKFKEIVGKDVLEASFEEQMTFVDWELKNTESEAGRKIKGTKTASEAAAMTEQKYERSAVGLAGGVQAQRVKNAEKYAKFDIDEILAMSEQSVETTKSSTKPVVVQSPVMVQQPTQQPPVNTPQISSITVPSIRNDMGPLLTAQLNNFNFSSQ